MSAGRREALESHSSLHGATPCHPLPEENTFCTSPSQKVKSHFGKTDSTVDVTRSACRFAGRQQLSVNSHTGRLTNVSSSILAFRFSSLQVMPWTKGCQPRHPNQWKIPGANPTQTERSNTALAVTGHLAAMPQAATWDFLLGTGKKNQGTKGPSPSKPTMTVFKPLSGNICKQRKYTIRS